MCYQRCESTADGSGLETECKGHRNRRETARREKRGKMKRERERGEGRESYWSDVLAFLCVG